MQRNRFCRLAYILGSSRSLARLTLAHAYCQVRLKVTKVISTSRNILKHCTFYLFTFDHFINIVLDEIMLTER